MSCSAPFKKFNKITKVYDSLPCGHCYKCLTDKRNAWSDRIKFDIQYSYKVGKGSSFCTYTYNDDNYPLDGSLSKDHAQKFLRFLKREVSYHNIKVPFGNNFHYYFVGEYGGKIGRPHYHAIFIGLDSEEMLSLSRLCWKRGFCMVYPAMSSCVRYVLKYLDKQSTDNLNVYKERNLIPPFAMISHGIGRKYLEDNIDFITENGGYRCGSSLRPMPYYYRKLIGQKITVPLPTEIEDKAVSECGSRELYDYRKRLALEQSYVAELESGSL